MFSPRHQYPWLTSSLLSRRRRRRRLISSVFRSNRLPIELIQGSLDLRLIIVSCPEQQQQQQQHQAKEVNRRCKCLSARMFFSAEMRVNRHDEIASAHVHG